MSNETTNTEMQPTSVTPVRGTVADVTCPCGHVTRLCLGQHCLAIVCNGCKGELATPDWSAGPPEADRYDVRHADGKFLAQTASKMLANRIASRQRAAGVSCYVVPVELDAKPETTKTYTISAIDGTISEMAGTPWMLGFETLPGVTDGNVLVTNDLATALPPIVEAIRRTAHECGEYREGEEVTVRAADLHDTVVFEHTFKLDASCEAA